MGLPRAKKRTVTVSSDEDEDSGVPVEPSESSEDERPAKSRKRSTGKLKSAKNATKKGQQPTGVKSTQNGSPQQSPAKSRSVKAKGRAASKDQAQPNSKPIYSFFNATTQRLQTSQPSGSPDKPSTPREEPEAIQDDSGEDGSSNLHLAKGSSTALAMRKRKVQHGDSFESDVGLPPQASQKFRKAPSGDRIPSFSVLNEDKRPWTDQFAPNDLSELAVHKRKVSDVRQWLELALNGKRQKVLVLKGAAGTGKTTTVRLLAKDLGLNITEWKNSAGIEMTSEGSLSSATQFDEFVGRASRAGGLKFASGDDYEPDTTDVQIPKEADSLDQRGQLLLVEEFPNTYSSSSSSLQSFRSAILRYLAAAPTYTARTTPIVMIISETLLSTNTALADSFTAHRVLGPELSNHPFVDIIEFNAVAQTYLTKALETVVLKEARKSGRRKTPGPQVLKRLAESGDIRSAVSSLEFLCLRGDDGDTWSSRVTFTKPKKAKTDPPLTQSEVESLKLISNRESTLGIFHAVGKVVYSKRVASTSIVHPPPWFPQHRREKIPENNVDELIDELGTDVSTFVAALHENYALSCSSSTSEEALDSLLGCADSISDAELLSVDRFSSGTRAFSGSSTDSLRQDEMAFQVAVRGLWFNLPLEVHRIVPAEGKRADAFKMFYPASLRLWKKQEEVEGVLDLLSSNLQTGSLFSASRSRNSEPGLNAGGVETWKRSGSLDTPSARDNTVDAGVGRINSAKTEMLIEHLPYVAQILSSQAVSTKVKEQLAVVTRIRGSAPVINDDGNDVDDDEQTGAEQWSTDRPDVDAVKIPKGNTKSKAGQVKLTEGNGLGIPVESRVERLVLADDDIVDD